ncbi:DEAD/DEAH box helicase [Candidatus Pacearchaeota archaeon]|nr:DEAD/DEAH box helicase [Candidatus Pacearchaeota archaeon]
MEKFTKLGLSRDIIKVLEESGFKEPTEIQEKAIPLAIAGKDVIGQSATGSGKTLVFGSAIIENLKAKKIIQALVLTPTRELAEQVAESLKKFSKYISLRVTAIYGGVAIEPQIKNLAVADVVVGTPGRILDHMQRGTIRLDEVKILVLDEVDRMFDMGFRDDVERIVSKCPQRRQTMFFSATITKDIDYFSKKYTKNAVVVEVQSYVDPSKLHQFYYDVPSSMKFPLFVHLLKHESSKLVMVFCNTRQNVDWVARNLKLNGINAEAIHGGLSQKKRSDTLEGFHESEVHVLVCTDVAARGLDIKGVSHIYNYDIPKTADDNTHRIGRTARAGEEGKAVHILTERDYDNFRKITKESTSKIKREEIPLNIERVQMSTERRFGGGMRGGNYGRRGHAGAGGNYGRRSYGSFGGGGRKSRDDISRSPGRGFRRGDRFQRENRDKRISGYRGSRHGGHRRSHYGSRSEYSGAIAGSRY